MKSCVSWVGKPTLSSPEMIRFDKICSLPQLFDLSHAWVWCFRCFCFFLGKGTEFIQGQEQTTCKTRKAGRPSHVIMIFQGFVASCTGSRKEQQSSGMVP